MRQRLRDVLFDTEDETWNAGEKDDIVGMAVRRLSRRMPRPISTDDTNAAITLVTATYYYSIDSQYTQVDAVAYENSDSDWIGYMQAGWEVEGDLWAGTGKLHVSPTTVEQLGTLYIRGKGRYTLPNDADVDQTAAILDDHVPVVLAWARTEAYRRMLSDRARFRQWQNANQTQNVSINELVQMVADADRQADDEWLQLRQWQRPVIGRIG